MITKKEVCIGMLVEIVQYDARSNETIHRGYIQRIITQGKSDKVKVELHNGESGVVIHILSKEELQLEAFKFYNKFLFAKEIYAIWHRYDQCYFTASAKENVSLYVFQTKSLAQAFIKKHLNEQYMVKEIKKQNKSMKLLFSKSTYDSYFIENERRISKEKLHQFENDLRKKS